MQALPALAGSDPQALQAAAPRKKHGTLYYVIGYPAGAFYILYQLGLQALRVGKDAGISFGNELFSMGHSGINECDKLRKAVPVAARDLFLPAAELLQQLEKETDGYSQSGDTEANKAAQALLRFGRDALEPPFEAATSGAIELGSYIDSGGREGVKFACATARVSTVAAPVVFEPVGLVANELLSMSISGSKETQKLLTAAPREIYRNAVIPLSAAIALIQEIWSYIPPGSYQLVNLVQFFAQICSELIERGTLRLVLTELLSYGLSGLHESKKAYLTSYSHIQEASQVIQESHKVIRKEVESLDVAASRELEKCKEGMYQTTMAAKIYFQEVAQTALSEIVSYIASGCNEGVKGAKVLPRTAVDTVRFPGEFLLENASYFPAGFRESKKAVISLHETIKWATDYPRELIEALFLEAFSYLDTGSNENRKFKHAVGRAISDGVEIPREILQDIALEFMTYLLSGAKETGKGARYLPHGIYDATIIPMECLESLFFEIGNYLASGTAEAKKINHLLKEDFPNTFELLVLDPLEIWWIPRKRLLLEWLHDSEQMVRQSIQDIHQRFFGL